MFEFTGSYILWFVCTISWLNQHPFDVMVYHFRIYVAEKKKEQSKKRTLFVERSHSNMFEKNLHKFRARIHIFAITINISNSIRLFGLRWHSRCDFIYVRIWTTKNNNGNGNGIDNVKSVPIIAHDLMNHPANQMDTFCLSLTKAKSQHTHRERETDSKKICVPFFLWMIGEQKNCYRNIIGWWLVFLLYFNLSFANVCHSFSIDR